MCVMWLNVQENAEYNRLRGLNSIFFLFSD